MARKMSISIGGGFLIPVRLDNVARGAKSNLHEYHKDDMGLGGRKKICKACGKDITDADIVKGLEVSKGNVVTFTKEELATLPLSTTKNIEIDRFVEAKELNSLTFDTGYYLSPQEVGAESAFNLFMEGLKKLGKVAIGKVAISQRENLCVIHPTNGGLVLSTMFWNNEIKPSPQVPKHQVTDEQIDLITQVISKYSGVFNYTDYSDKYLDALSVLATKKLAGEVAQVTTEQDKPQQNLEDVLKALVKGN